MLRRAHLNDDGFPGEVGQTANVWSDLLDFGEGKWNDHAPFAIIFDLERKQ